MMLSGRLLSGDASWAGDPYAERRAKEELAGESRTERRLQQSRRYSAVVSAPTIICHRLSTRRTRVRRPWRIVTTRPARLINATW